MCREQVLVTGGSGFVAAHCIAQLLGAGYKIRTTVRSLDRETFVRAMLQTAGTPPGDALSFAAADLTSDAGWSQAVEGCRYVLHVASPFPARAPKNEDELIRPAVEGTLRVLRASRDAGVRRVVLTSSSAAITYGHPPRATPFTEEDWTDPAAQGVSTYAKSKTLAERAAWEFVAREGGSLELASVNPVGVFGPVLGPDFATSIVLVQRFLDGAMPGCPRIWSGIVDVRDLAALHIRAMTNPAARGERFLACAGEFISFVEMAKILKTRMGATAGRVTTRELPDWLMRFAAIFIPDAALIIPELGNRKNAVSDKARRMLGWVPRSREDALTATGESLLRLGLLKGSSRAA